MIARALIAAKLLHCRRRGQLKACVNVVRNAGRAHVVAQLVAHGNVVQQHGLVVDAVDIVVKDRRKLPSAWHVATTNQQSAEQLKSTLSVPSGQENAHPQRSHPMTIKRRAQHQIGRIGEQVERLDQIGAWAVVQIAKERNLRLALFCKRDAIDALAQAQALGRNAAARKHSFAHEFELFRIVAREPETLATAHDLRLAVHAVQEERFGFLRARQLDCGTQGERAARKIVLHQVEIAAHCERRA